VTQEIASGDRVDTSFFQSGSEGMSQIVKSQILDTRIITGGSERFTDVRVRPLSFRVGEDII